MIGSRSSLRIECRIPGADVNPYLAYAALIASGLHGMDGNMDPGQARGWNGYDDHASPLIHFRIEDPIDALDLRHHARLAGRRNRLPLLGAGPLGGCRASTFRDRLGAEEVFPACLKKSRRKHN